MSNLHIPVLQTEVLEAFSPLVNGENSKTLLDCTLGGAGHTAALLEYFPKFKVLGCDVDANAIQNAKPRLSVFGERIDYINTNFSHLIDESSSWFPEGFAPPWDGILLDLGYSSNQLQSEEYGMSFQLDAPIDMRLSRKGMSAWELIEDSSALELAEIFKVYGEMPSSHRIAEKIKSAVQSGEIRNSTLVLAQFLERVVGRRHMKIHPATLVFQALRIAVNDELRVLDHFLEGVILKMSEGGRIAIITFHSLEDRIVKKWGLKNKAKLNWITKKPITASVEELKINPRSRSAKLRVFEKRTS